MGVKFLNFFFFFNRLRELLLADMVGLGPGFYGSPQKAALLCLLAPGLPQGSCLSCSP